MEMTPIESLLNAVIAEIYACSFEVLSENFMVASKLPNAPSHTILRTTRTAPARH